MIEDLANVDLKPALPCVAKATRRASQPAEVSGIRAFVDQISRTQTDVRHALAERQAAVRRPFPYLVRVTPWDPDRRITLGEPLSVVGKHLSHEGFGFYHTSPLPFRYVVAEFEIDQKPNRHGLVVCLIWCRFLRDQWYDSGGKFTQILNLRSSDSKNK